MSRSTAHQSIAAPTISARTNGRQMRLRAVRIALGFAGLMGIADLLLLLALR
jgi:hypothetical protein